MATSPADEVVEVGVFGLHGLAAAEGEQLADECGGAPGGLDDLVEALAGGCGGGQFFEGDAGVSLNGLKEVVEIVGDAAGQLADGLHFLCVMELSFEARLLGLRVLQFGDVAPFGDEEDDFTGLVADGLEGEVDGSECSLRIGMGGFEADEIAGGGLLDALAHAGLQFRGMPPPGGGPDGFSEDLGFPCAEEFECPVIEGQNGAVEGEQPHELEGLVEDGAKTFLAVPERALGALAYADLFLEVQVALFELCGAILEYVHGAAERLAHLRGARGDGRGTHAGSQGGYEP